MLQDKQAIEEIDFEWLDLIIEARDLGITIEEIRDFLREAAKKIG
ncbi:anti-repressor SinI family protein [Brevibacillus sp. B_LB10_24]